LSTLQSRIADAFEHRKSLTPTHGKPSKAGLAKAAKITAASISQWFDGSTKNIKADALLRAAKYLGVSPSWLASGSGEMLDQDYRADRQELTALQQATIEALSKALHEGRLTEMDCLDLMKSWL
jgi:transcriptional regulator with XRE-family HTH domain